MKGRVHAAGKRVLLLSAAALFGFSLRFALLLLSAGSNDMANWEHFAHLVDDFGIVGAYKYDVLLNNPPLACVYSWIMLKISVALNLPFSACFKTLPVLADSGTAILICLFAANTGGRKIFEGLAAYALSIPAILITGYHGNLDGICVFFVMLSLYLFQVHKYSLCSSFALALAFNLKLIPILLIPPFFASLRQNRDRLRFFSGVLVGTLPFLITGAFDSPEFFRNVVCYHSILEPWGINFFLWGSLSRVVFYHNIGSYLILLIVLVVRQNLVHRKREK